MLILIGFASAFFESQTEETFVMLMTEKISGELWLDETTIHYKSLTGESWSFPLAELLVFGEYTTPEGPFLDDYFFVFLTTYQHSYGASFYSEGREAFLKVLGTHCGVSFECKLVGSTNFASNVLWPKDIAGERLYQFSENPAQSLGLRVLHWFGFGGFTVTYSQQVLTKLGQRT